MRKLAPEINLKKGVWLLMIVLYLHILFSASSYGGSDSGNCRLSLVRWSTLLTQEPLKSEKKFKLSRSERHRFDAIGTNFECEIAFNGSDAGTSINCWKKDLSIGLQADRSMQKGKGQANILNLLSISDSDGKTTIELSCK